MRIASFPPALESNPYQRLLYSHLEAEGIALAEGPEIDEGWFRFSWLRRHRGSLDVLHLHWPQGLWRHSRGGALGTALSWVKLATLAVRLPLAHRLGYQLVWTVHQVEPHESRGHLDLFGAKLLARYADVLIAHDEETRADVEAKLGHAAAAKIAIVPHGSYGGAYPPPERSRDEVRAELGIAPGAFAFLCFGELRAYKGVDRLLEAFSAADLPDAALVIAGRVGEPELGAEIEAAAARDPRIKPQLGFIPDERVIELFGACDASVLARRPGTSGSLVLSLTLGLPIVVPRAPAYADLVGDGEAAGWLFDGDDPSALPAVLERAAADSEAAHAKTPAAIAAVEHLGWPSIAARTAALLSRRSGGA